MIGLSEYDLRVIRDTLKEYPEVHQATLFGSRAKGTHKPGSDVDISIKGDDLLDVPANLMGWLNDESQLPYFFDIINYASIESSELKEHIDRVGIVIYKKS